jgi:hypothetical protein
MKTNELERCCICDDPTGRSGIGDDSIYDDDGNGPYCPGCFWDAMGTDKEINDAGI